MAATAITEVFEDEDVNELAAAESLASKRNRQMINLDPPTRRRRLYAFLARRGYAADVVAHAVAAVTREVLAVNSDAHHPQLEPRAPNRNS